MEADLKRTAEALLFAAPEPLSLSRMQAIIPRCDRRALREALTELGRDYDEGGHAFQLLEIGGGWRIVTRPEYARRIEALLKGQRRVRLSRASLESVAVVAYRQPCTRVDVEAVRGVSCGGSLATLLERGLIRITGRAETLGRPLLYGTTDEFLSHLGINKLSDLPQLAEIESLLQPLDEEAEQASPVPSGERQDRLVQGMESIAELIGESQVPDLIEDAEGNGNGSGPLPEMITVEQDDEGEHADLLEAGRTEEVEQLCETEGEEIVEEAVAAAAGANGGDGAADGTLALIARALEPKSDTSAETSEVEES